MSPGTKSTLLESEKERALRQLENTGRMTAMQYKRIKMQVIEEQT